MKSSSIIYISSSISLKDRHYHQYYNNDLLEIFKKDKQLRLDFIDDILYEVQSKTAAVNASELELLLIKAEKWWQRHDIQFK